jgi:hypothetical protein
MEHYHCNLALKMLMEPNKGLFAFLPQDAADRARRLFIQCVVATGDSSHASLVAKLEQV